jgi:hypothetical protein
MKKTLFILWIPFVSLYAQTVSFKETKFVEALELYTYRDGNVSYDDTKTVVRYHDGKVITKMDNNLTVENQDGKLLATINLNKKPEVALYFSLTKALFSKDFNALKESFEVKELKDKKYQFVPKGDTKEAVSGIELFLNQDDSIDFFMINFTNRDTIKIEAK